MKRAIIMLLTVILTLSFCCTFAYSHEVPDITRKGSVSVTVRYGGVAVPGGSMTLYRVGDIIENDGNFSFALVEELSGLDVSLEDLESKQLIKTLQDKVRDADIEGRSHAVDLQGNARFNDLVPGLYLLVQDVAATGYSISNPFLISLPVYIDGKYIYDITADAKAELEIIKDTTYDRNTSHIIDKDEPGLPQTGQLKWPIPILVVAGIALVAVGCILCFANGKSNEA